MSIKLDRHTNSAPAVSPDGEASSSSAPQGAAPRTPQAAAAGPTRSGLAPPPAACVALEPKEDIVLLQFREKESRKAMEGFERTVRSTANYMGELPDDSGPKFHHFLSLSFHFYESAVEHTKVVEAARPNDKQGNRVEVFHKTRRDARPPVGKRRGAASAPYYALFEEALAKGEALEQRHKTKTDNLAPSRCTRRRKVGKSWGAFTGTMAATR